MELRSDPLVSELQELAPEICVEGGSFAHWLPPPAEVPFEHRQDLRLSCRTTATRASLLAGLRKHNLPLVEPRKSHFGDRVWPLGYCGSVSHKGTKVATALASTELFTSIGIDIEMVDKSADLENVRHLWNPSELPNLPLEQALTAVFSAKESAFKALSPIIGHSLKFEEIKMIWTSGSSSKLHGQAFALGRAVAVSISVDVPRWIASVALMKLQRDTER